MNENKDCQKKKDDSKSKKETYETPVLKECGTIKELTKTTVNSGTTDADTWS